MTNEAAKCVEALRRCPDPSYDCSQCPVYVRGSPCCNELTAANIIESLSSQLEEVQQKLDAALVSNKSLSSQLGKIVQERDAAVSDIERLQGLICQVCKEYYQPNPEIRKWSCRIFGDDWGDISEDGLLACGKFKWRGIQKEENHG